MSSADSCCVSRFVSDECHKDKFRAEGNNFHKIVALSKEQLLLLYLRVPGLKEIENELICDYHYKRYISFYSSVEYKCCDPWHEHTKQIRVDLKIIDLELSEKIKNICNLNVVPGKKICKNCTKKFFKEIKSFEDQDQYCIDPFKIHRTKITSELFCLKQESVDYLLNLYNMNLSLETKICNACNTRIDSDILKYNESSSQLDIINSHQTDTTNSTPELSQFSSTEFQSDSQKKRNINDILDTFGMLPFKRQKLNYDRTVQKGVHIVQNIVNHVSEAFECGYTVKLPKFDNIAQMSNESSWFQNIIANIQKKYKDPSTTFNEKISLLTLLPEYWKFAQVNKYVQCTYYMFNEAKKLRENTGVMGKRVRKTYLLYSPEVKKEIADYYLDDTNSSLCSGAKECITVKVSDQSPKVFQKRMILYDLKDLYNNWIQQTTCSSVPCLAFFCQLKPQQCFFAGEPGTHNICVCPIHQNVKLKLTALGLNVSYKEAIAASVCSIENKNCMFHECSQCPPKETIYTFLGVDIDTDKMENVKYKIWDIVKIANKGSDTSSFNRMSLVQYNEPFQMVLTSTSDDIYNMTEHHFISTKQKEYYIQCRKVLDQDTGVLCMDFAENYSFVAQNSIQGLYYNNVQATLFTAVLYYKDECDDNVSFQSFCVISDSTIHQAYSVHAFQEAIIKKIKKQFPWIKKLIYFSDGAPTQFKNKNHLINVCYHEKDFDIIVISHNFFMTSHGKSAADGIGAAAKRMSRRAVLQGICILNAQQMYEHLSSTESDIKYFYVSNSEVESRGRHLNNRFKLAKTIQNTRKYHCFEPIDLKTMKVKQYSSDSDSHVVNVV